MLELKSFKYEFGSSVYNYETEQLESTTPYLSIETTAGLNYLLQKRAIRSYLIYTFISIEKW